MFTEANNPNRSLRRRYYAVDSQSPLPDIDCRDVVCRASEPAEDTLKSVPRGTVGFVDVGARRAGTARIARVNQKHRYSTKRSLVRNKATQFVESPIAQSFALSPCGLDTITDAFEVFESNRTSPAFGFGNDGFGYAVVGVPLEARLLARGTFKSAFCRPRSNLLQSATPRFVASPHDFNLGPAEGVAFTVAGKVDDAEVNPDNIGRNKSLLRFHIAGQSEHPFATHKHKIGLAFSKGDTFTLMHSAGIGNGDTTSNRPDRYRTIEHTKDARIERLRGVAMEGSLLGLASSLETVSNLCNGTHRSLSRQSEATANLLIQKTVKVKLSSLACTVGLRCDPIAGCVTRFQRVSQSAFLIGIGKQSNWGYQLHLTILLSLDIATHNSIGNVSNRTRVVTATPKSRKAGAERRKLLSEYATGLALEPIHYFGNAKSGVAFNKQMHMVRHHFHRVNRHAMLSGNFTKDCFQTSVDGSYKDFLPVFGTPYKVIFEAEDSSRISGIALLTGHKPYYTHGVYLKPDCAPHNSLSLCQLKQAVSRETL